MNAKTLLAERFLKHRTLCWSVLDIKLSFLPCFYRILGDFGHEFVVFCYVFEVFLMNFGYQIDAFAIFLCFFGEFGTVVRTVCGQCWWHFRGVEDSGENCVPSVFVVLVLHLVFLSFASLQAQVSCLNKRSKRHS